MSKHLNPLEKEFLIRQYKSNTRIKMRDFCEANHISTGAFQKWIKQYDEGGLEGLARADSEIKDASRRELTERRNPTSVRYSSCELRMNGLKKTMSCRRRILGNRSSFV
mgnify:CR=1 FL=1